MTSYNIQTVDIDSLSAALVEQAVNIIKKGGTVIYPTSGLYGLGADATVPEAVEKIFRIKQRAASKPVSILISSPSDIFPYVHDLSSDAKKIISYFWPGKVTLVCRASDTLPETLTAGTGNIGIRVPAHPVAAALLARLDRPLTGTSANLSGTAGCSRIVDISHQIIEQVDLILNAGALEGGSGSTVVDVTVDPPEVLREGAVSSAELFSVL